jgi:DNA-binding MltR family transcriptional regulator
MRKESERGCALVGAAFIDDALGELLAAHFVDDKITRRLLTYPGPCSTLSARCDLAYCLGMFGRDIYMDVRGIIKIRNQFAHHRFGPGFEDEAIATSCRNLNTIQQMRARGTDFACVGARTMFIMTAGAVILALDVAKYSVQRCQRGPGWAEIPQPPINPLGY